MIHCILIICILILDENTKIYNHHKLIYYIYGGIFAKLVGHIQIARLGRFEFDQFRPSVILVLLTTPLSIVFFNYGIINENSLYSFLIILIIYSIYLYYQSFTRITDELCLILDIDKFSIDKQLGLAKKSNVKLDNK